jgi:hypothetical protein
MAWHDVGQTRRFQLEGERVSGRIAAAMKGSLRHWYSSVAVMLLQFNKTPRGESGDRTSA